MEFLPKKTISQLNFATSILENHEIEINNNGNSEKISIGQLISKINTNIRLSTNGFLGQIISGFRTDIPNGYLRLDGAKYENMAENYTELRNAFINKQIPFTENITDWLNKSSDLNSETRGSVFTFCVNFEEDYFYVPKLKKHQYIANGTSIGEVYLDQMQRMSDTFMSFDRGYNSNSKLFKVVGRWSANVKSGNGDNWGTHVLFDNADIVRTGDQNWGFHAECPYFICVNTIESGIDSNIYAKKTELELESAKRNNQYNELLNITLQLEEKLKNNDKGRFFDTTKEMNAWLSNPNNVELLNIGFRFFIGDQNSPDYLWTGSNVVPIEKGEILLDDYYTKSIIDQLLKNKVDKITGKQLSTNDYTNEDKNKLNETVSKKELSSSLTSINETIQEHANNSNNPHKVTAKLLGVYTSIETDKLINDNTKEIQNNLHDIYDEIKKYGLKYAKIKELINKCDAANFVVSCEYTKYNLGYIQSNSNFAMAIKERYNNYYSQIEIEAEENLDELEFDFTDLVSAELERITNTNNE